MIMHAFAGEIVERIQCEARARNWIGWCGIG